MTTLGLAAGKAAAGEIGSRVGRQIVEWARGSEARRLVELLVESAQPHIEDLDG